MSNTIAFNTGRAYTECGQRIAARRLASGAVVMVDIDRGIDYLLPIATELTKRAVMQAYDENDVIYASSHEIGEYYTARNDLCTVALTVDSI